MKALLIIIICSVIFIACVGVWGPVSTDQAEYQTGYGTVTQVNEYPLFSYKYTADYKFDEFLETGHFPSYSSINSFNEKFACTCFSVFGSEKRMLARNYDWPLRSTSFIVFTDPPDGYASVSMVDLYFFNYNHSEPPDYPGNESTLSLLPYHPFDGMNEKGVAAGMNALPRGSGPYDAGKVTIGELQVIRLVLDYAGSTSEAINLIRQYNVRMEDPPIHYLIADSSGHSVIIEFVDGSMEIRENKNPWQVTTNFILSDYENPFSVNCWRYQTAWQTLEINQGFLSGNEAINLLQDVSVTSTRWSVLYNLKNGQLQLFIGRDWQNPVNFTVF